MFTLPPNFNPDDMRETDDLAVREQIFKAVNDPETHPLLPDPGPLATARPRARPRCTPPRRWTA
jgi:hypothetical protein